VLKDMI